MWDMVIDIDRDASRPLVLQIARALITDIQRGRLRPGDQLPGSRRLADHLQVHRNTVLAALAELIAEGWIEAAPGRGTFVARTIPDDRGRPFSRRLGTRAKTQAQVPFALPRVPDAYRPPVLPPGTLNLSNGAPDIRLVPAQ
jgi:GntR family transcriptional regulator/MocR family aminotransferase